jgi:Tol biopolymer transport system component
VLAVSAPAVGSSGPPAGELVFTRADSFSPYRDIYVVRTDGRGLRRLTRDRQLDRTPEWSPNRRRIAFTRVLNARQALVVMNADGRHQHVVARAQGLRRATWSPDSRRLVYSRYRVLPDGNADWDTYIVGADGRGNRPLLATADWVEVDPDWSSRNEIVLMRERADTRANTIAVVRSDGSGLRQVKAVPFEGSSGGPAWSPNGRRIAVSLDGRRENPARTPGDLYVISASGGPLRRIARRAENPSWSPNGRWVAFSESAGYPGAPATTDALEIIRASGRGHRTVLLKRRFTTQYDDQDQDWRPR